VSILGDRGLPDVESFGIVHWLAYGPSGVRIPHLRRIVDVNDCDIASVIADCGRGIVTGERCAYRFAGLSVEHLNPGRGYGYRTLAIAGEAALSVDHVAKWSGDHQRRQLTADI